MKKTLVILFSIAVCVVSCKEESKKIDTSKATELSTELDSVSYVLGHYFGTRMRSNIDSNELRSKSFMTGIQRGLEGKNSEIEKTTEKELMGSFMEAKEARVAKEIEEKYAPRKEASDKWLAEVKSRPGVKELEPGLYYKVIKEGSGRKAGPTDDVTAYYKGQLIDGTVFDQTVDGQPRTFGVNRVIPGWTKALQQMPVGSKWIVYISSELGYGLYPRAGGKIMPNDALEFEIEILDVKKGKAAAMPQQLQMK